VPTCLAGPGGFRCPCASEGREHSTARHRRTRSSRQTTPDVDLMSSRPNWAKSRRVRVDGTLRQKERPKGPLASHDRIDHLKYGQLLYLSGRYVSSPGTVSQSNVVLALGLLRRLHHVVSVCFVLILTIAIAWVPGELRGCRFSRASACERSDGFMASRSAAVARQVPIHGSTTQEAQNPAG
jgi:hypothetical protein